MNLRKLAENVANSAIQSNLGAVQPTAPVSAPPGKAYVASDAWKRKNLTHALPAAEKQKIYAKTMSDLQAGMPKRMAQPKTPSDVLARDSKALARGLWSALKVTSMRTGESLVDLVTGIPAIGDRVVFGSMLGIDNGRGLIGGRLDRFHRYVDENVHDVRQAAEDAEWADGSDRTQVGKLNRFIRGAGADTVGSFLGFGGLGSLVARGRDRLIGTALGSGFALYGALDGEGGLRQLRDREEASRLIGPGARGFINPVSTKANQSSAYTPDEYRRYHIPESSLPSMWSERVNIPYSWLHDRGGAPLQFREYGT